MNKLSHPRVGSSLVDFLKEEQIYDECNTVAVKEVLAWQLEQVMKEKGLSKTGLAEKMKTSRAALDRLLNPKNNSVTLHTIMQAANAVGKHVRIEFV